MMNRTLLLDILKELKEVQATVIQKPTDHQSSSIFTKCGIDFPIKNETDLEKFEEFLKQEHDFTNAVSMRV